MKLIFFVSCFTFVSITAKSQSQPAKGDVKFSGGAELALPIGDFNEASRVGFGLSSQADYYLSKTVSMNLSAGYLSFQGKSQNISGTSITLPNLNIIPILAGTRVRIKTKFFSTAQLGLSFLNYEGVKSSDFTYVVGLGYQLSKTDLQLRYNSINTDGSTLNYLGLRFAYNF